MRNDFLHWFLYGWCLFWIILSLGVCLVWLYHDKMPGHREVRWVSFAPRVTKEEWEATISIKWYCRCGKMGMVSVKRGEATLLYDMIATAHGFPLAGHDVHTNL